MIEVRLFGDLRHYAPDPFSGARPAPSGVAVQVASAEARTVGQVLALLGIDPVEVGNLFLNGRLVPRSRQAIHLGYPLAGSEPLSREASQHVAVEDGDRLGIFARNMSVLVV
jgi:hypothetical protein